MQEIWKDIHGYKGIYKASSKGRIISLDRTIEHNIVGSKKVEGKMLKQYLDNHGYLRINLSKNGNVKKHSVHRLIALSFLGHSDLSVNHIDGIKTNNNIGNLEYVTMKRNIEHAVSVGLIKNNSKINEKEIIKDYLSGYRLRDLERKYKTSHQNIKIILIDNKITMQTKGQRKRKYNVEEKELLFLINQGKNNSQISRELKVPRHCVRYRRQLLESRIKETSK